MDVGDERGGHLLEEEKEEEDHSSRRDELFIDHARIW